MNVPPPIKSLIDLQRRLLESGSPLVRGIGSLLGAGALDKDLSLLRDRQIGQLLIDVVEPDLRIASPEAVICRQATKRLIRSTAGKLEDDESESPPCPICGNKMLLHVGIDEPDYKECVSLDCQHREYASDDGETK